MTSQPRKRAALQRVAARWRGRRVGLYGGSFNPGHAGHLHVALTALKRLKLDAVWLLVSPGNPFKDAAADMADFDARLESARELADTHPQLIATDIEQSIGTRYTAETAQILSGAMPQTQFIWMMGADNALGFHRWMHSDRLARILPIAIFDRPGYSMHGLSSRFVQRNARFRMKPHDLANARPPAWTFIPMPRHWASATEIRQHHGLIWAKEEDAI